MNVYFMGTPNMKKDWSLYEMIPIWLVVSPVILVVSPRVYPIMVGGITKGYPSMNGFISKDISQHG